jgi:hypothetical protein
VLLLRVTAPLCLSQARAAAPGHLQADPNLLAVAAGDPFVRVYDRRCLSLMCPGSSSTEPLLELAPPHLQLPIDEHEQPRRAHPTSVCFSGSGGRCGGGPGVGRGPSGAHLRPASAASVRECAA